VQSFELPSAEFLAVMVFCGGKGRSLLVMRSLRHVYCQDILKSQIQVGKSFERSHLNGLQDGPLFGGYGTPIFLYSKDQEIISIKPS
jgi:hypothetical protein